LTVAVSDAPAPKLPFWIHQVVEYGIGALVAYQAIHSPRPVVPLLAGLVVVLLAATADGPAACFHAVSRPVHRILDVVVAGGLLVVAFVFADDMGGAGQILLVLGALALLALTLRSDYRPKAARERRTRVQPQEMGSDRAEAFGRSAGRLVGRGVQEYRRRKAGPGSGT
jgi:hypothetical protein